MLRILFLAMGIIIFNASTSYAQTTIKGKIGSVDSKGNHAPLPSATVFWQGTEVFAVTDNYGNFEIEKDDSFRYLIVRFVGFYDDTVDTKGMEFIHFMKRNPLVLDEVEVLHRDKGMEINTMSSLNTQVITARELTKAACCNLSESFETNPSIDVSFTDAVTGARQIQMLGLSGPNILITRELMPDVRGLSSVHGLQFIPGTWIQSMQLHKGSASVVNGFESVVGQINVELKKPESGEKAMINGYVNGGGAMEFNANVRNDVSKKLSTASMVQLRGLFNENDRNDDNFMDMPKSQRLMLLNRWKYVSDKGTFGQIGVRLVNTENEGGQLSSESPNRWELLHVNRKVDIWTKTGKVWENKPYKSIGLQLNGTFHDLNSKYGNREYNGIQKSLFANLIYQSIISNTNHQFKAGLSFQLDDFNEDIDSVNFIREEYVPGTYFEYTFLPNARFTLVAGIRADLHNNYGLFFSPRLHARYALSKTTTVKISGGKSFRTASIFAENAQIFASSRNINIINPSNDKRPYGLNAEEAWNYGIHISQQFRLDYRDGAISLDLYRTDFMNQIVVDYEDADLIKFYNLQGESYSNSAQVQLDYEVINRLDVRLAYRYYDVKTDYITWPFSNVDRPFISSHRAFANLAYTTRNYWSFDATVNWNGSKRIPYNPGNTVEDLRVVRSPDFYLINAQVSKTFREVFDIYLGAENLFDFRQNDPIINSDNPFGNRFDASLVWGPVFGRMVYAGFRYKWL